MALLATPDGPSEVVAREAASRYYHEMEAVLADRKFLAGSYSFADIAFYMAQLFAARMGAGMTSVTPRLRRWREAITARPAVRQVVHPMVAFIDSRDLTIPDFLSTLRPPGPSASS
jgi:glutathione S-transferase